MSLQQVGAGVGYALTTSIQPFLTKSLLSSAHRFPLFALLVLRTLVGLLAVELLRRLGWVRGVRPYSLASGIALAPASCFYALCLWSTVKASSGMNIPMYTALRQCTPLATLVLAVSVMGKPPPSPLSALAVLTITVGCAFAGIGDITFDGMAYAICIVSVFSLAMYSLLIQEAAKKYSVAEVFYINCYNVLPLTLLGSLLSGELAEVWQQTFELDATFYITLCATVVSANLLTYSLFLCTHLNSAMTTSFIGVLKSIPQTFVGLFTFGGMPLNGFNIIGLSLNLAGGVLFVVSKQREKPHTKAT